MNRATFRVPSLAKKLSASLVELERPGGENSIDSALKAVEDYERLAGEVYRLRVDKTIKSDDPAIEQAEELLSNTAQDLVGFTAQDRKSESAYVMFLRQYRVAWRKHFQVFIFLTCLFVASCFMGWNIGVNQPDYLSLIASQDLIEMIHDQEAWFERLEKNPIMGAFQIGWNNIQVAITGFVLGALFGLGGLYIVVYNGIMFGAILGYCSTHDFDDQLLTFVASHGPLELTLIVASAFAGLLIGRSFYRLPLSKMRERVGEAASEAGILALGIIPWLTLAAFFEGFVSPVRSMPFAIKAGFGLIIAVAFWAWTLGPVPEAPKEKSREL
jgi:uncharacterized membrane protein SpoIIM required for sporulation